MSLLAYFMFLPIKIATAFIKTIFHSLFKLRWTPSSKAWLRSLDKKIRAKVSHPNEGKYVQVTYGQEVHSIWTVTVKGSHGGTVPLVLVHGMGGGSDMFLNNIDALAEWRDIILIDLPGFGLSSRPQLRVKKDGFWRVNTTADDIEEFYTEILNLWFEQMGLDKFILLGHSYGGFLCSVFCLKYPERVQHLILADPWGFPRLPSAENRPFTRSKSIVLLSKVLSKMNIFTPLRMLGPLGPFVLNFLRADLKRKFHSFFDDNTFSDYFYAVNTCDSPSGEIGFSRLADRFGWSKKPFIERVVDWTEDLDVTFIYGARSWVDSSAGKETQHLRPTSYVDCQVIIGAGHHVFADRPKAFNDMVNKICQAVDEGHKPDIVDRFEQRNRIWAKLLRRPSCDSLDSSQSHGGSFQRGRTMSAQELFSQQIADSESIEEHDQGEDEEVTSRVQFHIEHMSGKELPTIDQGSALLARKSSLKTTRLESVKTVSRVAGVKSVSFSCGSLADTSECELSEENQNNSLPDSDIKLRDLDNQLIDSNNHLIESNNQLLDSNNQLVDSKN